MMSDSCSGVFAKIEWNFTCILANAKCMLCISLTWAQPSAPTPGSDPAGICITLAARYIEIDFMYWGCIGLRLPPFVLVSVYN